MNKITGQDLQAIAGVLEAANMQKQRAAALRQGALPPTSGMQMPGQQAMNPMSQPMTTPQAVGQLGEAAMNTMAQRRSAALSQQANAAQAGNMAQLQQRMGL